MIKLAIVGSREFTDYLMLLQVIKYNTFLLNITTIVSGGARGTDTLAERYANDNHLDKKIFRAKWDVFGKVAGHMRNTEIVEYCDLLIAFWDGKSTGTYDSIKKAQTQNKLHHIEYIYL